jgi:endonuclease VIII
VPEGDTIHRTARRLHAVLSGKVVTRFEAPRLAGRLPVAGTVVTAVEARGKHCLLHFGDGRALRTHLRMTGSWHLYRPGERWRKQRGAARVVLEVGEGADAWVAVCFAAPEVELLEAPAAARHQGTAHLGPDLCLPDADVEECLRRLAAVAGPDTEIGDALLDQRVACGVGNVYKSEACFAAGIDPFTPIVDLDEAARRRVWTVAARQLRANLDRAERRTHERGLAVYGRRGLPCHRCGTPVRMARQGEHARSTYWCPTCQR